MKRTFIAIKVPFNEKMKAFQDSLISSLTDDKISWVSPQNSHITLQFLGDTNSYQISQIDSVLQFITQSCNSSNLEVTGAGIFKKGRFPKVIWFGIKTEPPLQELQMKISTEIYDLGFKSDHPEFKPHLTIGRIKYIKNISNLESLIKKNESVIFQNLKVSEITFFESELNPKGAIYKELKSYSLKN